MSNGESQAGPAILAGNRGIRLGKLLKQVFLLLGGDANPGVTDLELNPISILGLDLVHIHGDGAVVRKFARVAQQIEQDLPNLCDISPHHVHVVGQMDVN